MKMRRSRRAKPELLTNTQKALFCLLALKACVAFIDHLNRSQFIY